jgi:hypothetical protein
VLRLLIVELCLILCSFYGFSLSIYGMKRHLAAHRYYTHKVLIWPYQDPLKNTIGRVCINTYMIIFNLVQHAN